ncbi:hypothetical protein DESHY_20118 [Desulforamulus hydrothermalis Lam5 = DSM 18033]|uniref:Uncharacterized protein n=1 Tax=Desulforamulus hydrothermalis Lam5 = DSM 18033 TaxID=1121428 RepID=K8DZ44_9FIRM|nr:hypothetical protein DESHY_20118 [Desulforamulus hydrothermalis Lam5 = DSM 18033]
MPNYDVNKIRFLFPIFRLRAVNCDIKATNRSAICCISKLRVTGQATN